MTRRSRAQREADEELHRDEIQRRGISMPTLEVSDGPEKLSLEGLYQMAKRVLEEWLARSSETYEWSPEELVELMGEGKTGDKRTQHELRLKEWSWFEDNFVGQIRTDLFEFHMHMQLEQCLKELQAEQDHLQWSLVAVRVERVRTGKQTQKRTENLGSAIQFDRLKKNEPVEQGKRTEWKEVPLFSIAFTCVFADLLGGDPKDPNASAQVELIPGASPMLAYAETRQIRDMPRGLRLQWERAERLLREFYGLPQREREALGRLRKRGPRDPAPTRETAKTDPRGWEMEERPKVETPKPPIVAEGLEATVKALADRGLPPASIAASVSSHARKVSVEQVSAILGLPATGEPAP